jgi:hypothetical protein
LEIKCEGKRPHGRPMPRWDTVDLEIGWESVDWIDLAQDRDKL